MTTAARNAKLAALHVMKKEQALDDDAYRDKLELLTGHRSAADLSPAQLDKALDGFHVKPNANKAYTAKMKALWIAAYNLGALVNGSDAALESFVARQTGKERVTFLTPPETNKVTEALKAICSRHGFHPVDGAGGLEARRYLLLAQWNRLAALGAVRIAGDDALSVYVSKKYLTCRGGVINMEKAQLDDCARAFGRWIRRAQAGTKTAAAGA